MAIIGDGFDSYVQTQIGVRQKSLGDFHNRKDNDLKAFNTRTPWIRLASAVDIEKGDETLPGISVRKTLQDMGYNMADLDGDKLAKNLVLFRGVSDSEGNSYKGTTGGLFGGAHAFTAGSLERGYVPMPGITSANFSYKNDGALAQGEINIKCFNRSQFQLLDVLYQRPGYTVLLEFGWSVYLGNDSKIIHRKDFITRPFRKMWESGNDMFSLSDCITTEKKTWQGNYDGFFGKITKFNWKFNGDGSYDITVNLIGLGDVIQSFKTNLAPSPEMVARADEGSWDDDDRKTAKKEGMTIAADAITTVLNNALFNIFNDRYWNNPEAQFTKTGAFEVVINQVPIATRNSNGEVTKWTKKTIKHPKGGYQIRGTETDAYKWYTPSTYITLNTLLCLLMTHCNMHNPSDESPIICYDFDFEKPLNDKNRMATFPGMYSGNPAKVLFPYVPVAKSITSKVYMPNGLVNQELTQKGIKFYANDDQTFAFLGNVYLDVNHITTILADNKDDDDNILLLDFLNAIMSTINLTSGGINEFRVIHDTPTNLIRIISEKPINESTTPPCTINTYGVKKDNGSFVRTIDLSAELTDKFATMISVGAQADGNSSAGNATAFSIYNKGLIDRVTPEKAVLTTTSASSEEETDPFKKIWTEEFTELFQECWGDPEIDEGYFYDGGFGMDFTSETVGPLEAACQEWAQLCTGKLTQKKQYPAPFFLPFNLSLTMDGLGGMKIYNAFKIDDKVLPPTYNSDHIELIIKSLSHEISETDWTTKVETLAKPIFGQISKPEKSSFSIFNRNQGTGGDKRSPDKGQDFPVTHKTLTNGYPMYECFFTTETKKHFIFLHHTAGHTKGVQSTINSWSKDAYQARQKNKYNRVSTHYVIDDKGNAEQLYSDKLWGGHAGVTGGMYLNKQALTLEIQNIGPLRKVGSNPPKFTSTYYKELDDGTKLYSKWPTKRYGGTWIQPVDNNYKPITYKRYDWYQKYTDAGIEATRTVVKNWMDKYSIPFHYDYNCLFPNSSPKCFPPNGASGNGVYTHNSVRSDKSDIFPQKEMLEMLKGIKTSGG